MRNNMRAVCSIFVPVFFSLFLLKGALAAEEFSADMLSRANGTAMTGKIFVGSGKVRMDMGSIITITRMDKQIVWMLMPEQNRYMEMPLQPKSVVAGSDKMPGEVERQKVGTEEIDGQVTDKYRIVSDIGDKQGIIFSWISTDSGIPVKTQAEDGSWMMEYKNIQPGQQPDDLFEIPDGYQKISNTMPSAAGMGDMSGAAGDESY